MSREEIHYTQYFREVMEALSTRGLLLGSRDPEGKDNLMTIGWGTIGTVWSKPIWIVLVRPSRHSFQSIERRGCFTLNVPPLALSGACETCGSMSGRDTDKFAECGLTAEDGELVEAPTVAQCPIQYECRVVHSNDVLGPRLTTEIREGAYKNGDYHRVYWGEILIARAKKDAASLLRR